MKTCLSIRLTSRGYVGFQALVTTSLTLMVAMDFVVISLPMSLRWEESDESWFGGSSNLSPRLGSFLVLRSISEFSITTGAENEVKEGRGELLGLEVGAMGGA